MVNCSKKPGDTSIALIKLLESLVSLNILEIICIVILSLIVFKRYFYKFNMEFTSKLINKYLPIKFTVWYKKYTV